MSDWASDNKALLLCVGFDALCLTHVDIFDQILKGLWENAVNTLPWPQVYVFYMPKLNLCTDSISLQDLMQTNLSKEQKILVSKPEG